ncbi:MAG: MurR/RpiR family transcriptional regulator [Faecalicoccus sp.]|nr:MurR/RpiR family transcriptional regulator [Faecalicoccus sp.]
MHTSSDHKCMAFIQLCNNIPKEDNNSRIANAFLSNISNIQTLSIEMLSQISNMSMSSVSRFIKQSGFKNFNEFKIEFSQFLTREKMFRSVSQYQVFETKDVTKTSNQIFDSIQNNLNRTKNSLDYDKLKTIISLCRKKKKVILCGDDRELEAFYTFQLDLLFQRIGAIQINIKEILELPSYHLEDSVIILFMVHYPWFEPIFKDLRAVSAAYQIPLVVFSQDTIEDKKGIDILYSYGKENDMNKGYYSLYYLNEVLCQMVVIESLE